MNSVNVTTKIELEAAMRNGNQEIIVIGNLANKLKKAKNISKLSKVGLGILTGVLGVAAITAPITGGLSFLSAVPVAALTGIEIAAIITASTLGIALVIAIFKGYDEVEFSDGKLILRKKK